jgi:hypothetical protein
MTEVDWQHRDSLRLWAQLAANGHAAAIGVASYHGLIQPAVLPPTSVVRQSPALPPQAPRAVTPATPQPKALTGVARRIDKFTRLVNPPPPPDLT